MSFGGRCLLARGVGRRANSFGLAHYSRLANKTHQRPDCASHLGNSPPVRSMDALSRLLHQLIDYAGLFPPAGLAMADAAREYATYRADPELGAFLGRFVLPAGLLVELERDAASHRHEIVTAPWRLSALVGANAVDDLELVRSFNARQHGGTVSESGSFNPRDGFAVVDALELKAGTPDEIEAAMANIPQTLDILGEPLAPEVYFEIPIQSDPADLVEALRAQLPRARAKVRTGGVTAEAFPSTSDLARFIERCVAAEVPFKATAGLHHPLRATYAFTYDPESPRGPMFGFLNVFLSAVLLHAGKIGADEVVRVLDETDAASIRFDETGIEWRGHRLEMQEISRARAIARSFGSCSFADPVDGLRALTLL